MFLLYEWSAEIMSGFSYIPDSGHIAGYAIGLFTLKIVTVIECISAPIGFIICKRLKTLNDIKNTQ